jgi:hypothetical protein
MLGVKNFSLTKYKNMSAPEGFIPANGSAGNSAPVVGGRRRSHKKLRLVKKNTVRRMLAKAGLKMRGGATGGAVGGATGGATGGRRHRSHKKTHRRRRSLFGMKY